MFVDEKCKTCGNWFTPKTVKNDKCKCMKKEDQSWNLKREKSKRLGFYHQKVNEETRKAQYEIFLRSLTRKV